jgi:hypothetical protein
MEKFSDEWRSLSQELSRLATRIDRVNSVNVNAADLRVDVAELARHYLQHARPVLLDAELIEHASTLDDAFSNLLKLSESGNAVSSYKKQIKRIRKAVPSITAGLALHAGTSRGGSKAPTADERKLLETIGQLVPSAAISYQQALADLQDERRVSFRGSALELREVLREVLDHLAPDKDVAATSGFKMEKDRSGPTMKQKVRFILKARGAGKTTSGTPEDSVNTVDAIVGDLTRSVYNLGSVATHVASERRQVVQVKRYIDAVLHDILEIS